MAWDVMRVIRTVFRAETSDHTRGAGQVATSTDKATRSIERWLQASKHMAESLRRDARGANELGLASDRARGKVESLGRTMRLAAIGYGTWRAAKGLVGVVASAESAQVAIAGLLQSTNRAAGGQMNFDVALQRSSGLLKKLKQEAIDTPGTFAQVRDAFNTMYMRASMAGMSDDAIVKLAGNVATKDMMMGGQGVVGRDVDQLMRGEIGDITTPELAMIKKEVAKQVRKGKTEAAMGMISNALDLDPAARKAAGRTFEGQLSTAKDKLTEIATIVGRPLFEMVNQGLADMGVWLENNREKVEEIAKKIGTGIVDAVKLAGRVIMWLVDTPMGNATLAAIGIVTAFNKLSGVLDIVKAHPVWATIALAAAAIGFIVKGVDGLRNVTPEQASDQAHGNRRDFGKVGGMMANVGNMMALGMAGNVEGVEGIIKGAASSWNDQEQNAWYINQGLAGNQRILEIAKGIKPAQSIIDDVGSNKTTNVNVDARGSRIYQQIKVQTNDPGRITAVSIRRAAVGIVARRNLGLATGRR